MRISTSSYQVVERISPRSGRIGVGLTLMLCFVVSLHSGRVFAEDASDGRIYFHREGRLASIRPDGKHLQWHTAEFDVKKRMDVINPFRLRIDPFAERLAFAVDQRHMEGVPNAEQRTLQIMDLTGEATPADVAVTAYSWCWSPDGSQIAVGIVERGEETPTTKNFVASPTTLVKTELRNVPSDLAVTDWSADGDWLLLKSPPYVKNLKVVIMARDGSHARPISTPPKDVALDGRFAPNGRQVLLETFNYYTRVGRLLVVDVENGNVQEIGPEWDAQSHGASWSPDGKRVASIWRMNARDPKPEQKAEYRLLVMKADGTDQNILLQETRNMPADESAAFRSDWVTLSGIDWR